MFPAELRNRIDETVVFDALSEQHIELIAGKLCDELRAAFAAKGVTVTVDDAVACRLARDGFDIELGARPLRRHIARQLEQRIVDALIDADARRLHASVTDADEILVAAA